MKRGKAFLRGILMLAAADDAKVVMLNALPRLDILRRGLDDGLVMQRKSATKGGEP